MIMAAYMFAVLSALREVFAVFAFTYIIAFFWVTGKGDYNDGSKKGKLKEAFWGVLIHFSTLTIMAGIFLILLFTSSILIRPLVAASKCEGFGCLGYAVILMYLLVPISVVLTFLVFTKLSKMLRKESEERWSYALAFNLAFLAAASIFFLLPLMRIMQYWLGW